jgi:hypothetical protein
MGGETYESSCKKSDAYVGAESILAFFDLWPQAFTLFYFEDAKLALLRARKGVRKNLIIVSYTRL